MLMTRYLGLLLFFHLISFFHLMPWTFVKEIILWPVWVIRCMWVPQEHKKICIIVGTSTLLSYANLGIVPKVPDFLRRRFEILMEEAAQ